MEESKMVLRTEDLVKKYGKRTVVSHVSINVKQGEIVGLLVKRERKDICRSVRISVFKI